MPVANTPSCAVPRPRPAGGSARGHHATGIDDDALYLAAALPADDFAPVPEDAHIVVEDAPEAVVAALSAARLTKVTGATPPPQKTDAASLLPRGGFSTAASAMPQRCVETQPRQAAPRHRVVLSDCRSDNVILRNFAQRGVLKGR
jgi:hypothetical protein